MSVVVRAQPRAPRPRAGAMYIAALILLGGAFWWTTRWMIARWQETGSYYSHGWLIPLISVALVFARRKQISALPIRPCAWGVGVLAAAALLQIVATAWQVGFLSGFALIGVLAGLILALMGTKMFGELLFPIVFLAFMVPVPEVLIEKVSFNLKLLAAGIASGVMEFLGLAVVREGSYIRVPDGNVVVDNVCSGLKYLIALAAFGALYAYISPLKRGLKFVLFALSMPISFAANVFRVTLMALVAYVWGVAAAEKWYSHDLFGILLFVVALALLWAVESALLGRLRSLRIAPASASNATEAPREPALDGQAGGAVRQSAGYPPKAALCVLALTAALSTYLAWPRTMASPTNVLASFPSHLGDWRGRDFKLEDRVYDILGTRDVLSRTYSNNSGEFVELVIVLSQQSGKRTHPPEQCFAGEAYTTISSEDRTINCSGGTALRVHELVFDRWDGRRVVWYFYKSGPHLNTSYWRHQAGVALRKLGNPAAADLLIRVDTFVRPDQVEHGRALLLDFLSRGLPPMLTSLP